MSRFIVKIFIPEIDDSHCLLCCRTRQIFGCSHAARNESMDIFSVFGEPLAWQNWLMVQFLFVPARRVSSGHKYHHATEYQISPVRQIAQESSTGCPAFLAIFLPPKKMSPKQSLNWDAKIDSARLTFSWEIRKICPSSEMIPPSPKPECIVMEEKP